MNQVQARTLAERREAALDHLRSNSNLWLATASDGAGSAPNTGVLRVGWRSPADGNVRGQPNVRASIGSTGDVLMIDATAAIMGTADIDTRAAEGYAQASGIPRPAPGFTYVQDDLLLGQAPPGHAPPSLYRAHRLTSGSLT